jgi:protein TonB
MSTMPAGRESRPSFGLRRAAPLALGIEAMLLGGALALLTHKAPPPPPPTVTTLTLSATPAAAPKAPVPAPPKPAPAAKPTPIAKPVVHPPPRPPVPVRHVSPPQPAIAPPPVPAPSPAPAPTPPTAAPNTPATDALPVPPAPPAPQPPAPPAPAAGATDPSFDATLRAAIEAALRYPESARMAGITGRVRVAFTYRDGSASDARIVVSSGTGLLDRAALAAVSAADYPKPAPDLAGKSLSKQLWVTFDLKDEQ